MNALLPARPINSITEKYEMADSPFPSKASEKRTSLAEMAARAAQRTSRPPPAPGTPPSSRNPASMAPRAAAGSYAPPASYASQSYGPPSADGNGSGLINLSHISQAPTLAPAVRAIDPHSVTPATPVSTPAMRAGGGGSKMVLAGVVVALVGIGVAYGLTSQNGSDAPSERAAALSEAPAALQGPPAGVAPPSPAKVEAPAAAAPAPVAALEKATVNTPPGTIAPAEATEITRAAVSHGLAKPGKARKAAAAPNAVAATGPSPGAAAIAAAVAAEAPAPAAAPPKAAAAPAPPALPATPEPTGLAGAIKKAVGPTGPAPEAEKAEAKAPPPRGDIPELPAQGAIQGALASPRANARNCLVGQEAPSRATITFASSGSVQNVAVTGPAAGTPAEACIKTAMSKTVVGAFKHATFSVSTTISPP
jgi:hypothetical protein